jgi:single-strand DNA-binding protein
MSGINKVILVGNLGAKPEVRTANNGHTWTTMSLATSESWSDKATGERKVKTEWHKVVVWGRLADVAAKYCDKGSKVYIEGRLETRTWNDPKSGDARYVTEVVLSGWGAVLELLDKKPGGTQKSGVEQNTSSTTTVNVPVPGEPESDLGVNGSAKPDFSDDGFGDDIPF